MSNGRTLPQEIVTDVLSQLPVKSLCRFKSVSPSWNSLISDPYFAITHLNRTTTWNPQYLYPNKIIMSTHHDLYSVDFADINWTATKLDFLTVEQRNAVEWARVWGSCDGLLLVSNEGNSNFILLNPSTTECKKLPTCPFFHALVGVGEFVAYAYGVGYDSCTDGYEVAMLSYSSLSHITIVAVYSLRNDAWWRLRDFPHIHWLGWRAVPLRLLLSICLMSFFKEVPLPVALDACKMGLVYELAALGIVSIWLIGSLVTKLKFG